MQIHPDEITCTKKTSLQLFYEGIKSDATRKDFEIKLKKVTCDYLALVLKGNPGKVSKQKTDPKPRKRGIKRQFSDADFEDRVNELVNLTREDPEKTEAIFLALAKKFKERSNLEKTAPEYLNPVSCGNYFKAVRKLFAMNNVPFSWQRIRASLPEDDTTYMKYEEYSHQDIQKMLDHATVLTKVIVLLWASSGIRAGAFDFKWKHIRPVYHYKGKLYWEDGEVNETILKEGNLSCAFIEIYADSKKWSYYGFVTPECWRAMQSYKDRWTRKFGSKPNPDDPFFANTRSEVIKPLKQMAIRRKLERLLRDAGIRTELDGLRRYNKPIFNAFRYFFNKQNKSSSSRNGILASLILKETMMGHTGLIKLDKHYFREHAHELIEEYLQSVPNLTISDEERAKLQVLELRRENSQKDQEFRLMELRILELEKKEQLRKEKTSEIKQVSKTIEELEDELQIVKNLPQTP